MPVREIAETLCCAPSTIYRELKRNFYRDDSLPQLNGHHPMNAQVTSERRRAIHRKLVV